MLTEPLSESVPRVFGEMSDGELDGCPRPYVYTAPDGSRSLYGRDGLEPFIRPFGWRAEVILPLAYAPVNGRCAHGIHPLPEVLARMSEPDSAVSVSLESDESVYEPERCVIRPMRLTEGESTTPCLILMLRTTGF